MTSGSGTRAQIEGPIVDQETQQHRYTVHGERDLQFTVLPEEIAGEKGWGVQIEGVPGPGIVHERPWPSVEAARDAAIRAVEDMLALERMQREEAERSRP